MSLEKLVLDGSETGGTAGEKINLAIDAINDKLINAQVAFMHNQHTPIYNLTTVPQTMDNFVISSEVGITPDLLLGEIPITYMGLYDVTVTASFTVQDSPNVRTLYLSVHNTTGVEDLYMHSISIPADATEVGGSFTFPFEMLSAGVLNLHISASEATVVSVEGLSFGVTSKYIR